MKQLIAKALKEAIKSAFKDEKISVSEDEIIKLIEIPPSTDLGDFAFPCFFLASRLKISPQDIALQIRKKIKEPREFQDIQTKGPYINFFLNRKQLAEDLIYQILNERENFGKTDIAKGKKVLVEFSQPNTHKSFHVGHIRGTSLGESLARIYEFVGEKVVRANYSGDTGMHIAKWIWCYKKYHSREKLKKEESWIASIYVDAVKRLAKSEKLQEEVDIINKKLEDKSDKELNKLWKETRILSINSWGKIYKELNTKFDIHFFESELEKRGKEIALELLQRGIAEKSEDAIIVNLEKYNLGVWVLLRKDGTVLYSAKDLALAEIKYKDYNLDDYLVVLGDEQNFHFQQLKKTLELMNSPVKSKYNFITFGMVRLPTGKMSSRTGENVLYSNFMEEVKDYTRKEIKKRNLKLSKLEIESRALKIAIAAIKFSMLKQDSRKVIIFNPKEAINFEGDTGTYLQYSYARANSILTKAKKKVASFKIKNLEQKEIDLIKKLSEFQEIVLKSYKDLMPSYIANYSYQLSQIFNEFYHACPVINSDNENFRIVLVESFKIVLKNSLNLLGIDVLEKM